MQNDNLTKYEIKMIDPCLDPRWDEFVYKHPNGWIVHLSGWKKVLENSFPHMKGHYLALTEGADDQIKAALPLFEVSSWILGKRLISIPFATICDPLVTSQEETKKLLDETFNLAKKLGASYLEIRTLQSHSLIEKDSFYCSCFYKHHYLLLTNDINTIKKSFHRTNVRQRIQRAEKSDLCLKTGNSETDLMGFHELHKTTRKKHGLPPQPYKFFKNLWDTFVPSGNMKLLMAQKNDKTIAALILFLFRDRVSAEFLASDDSYWNLSPNHLLFWEAIKTAHNEGFKIFDFGRTSSSNGSLMDFKKHWGTTVVDLPQFIYPNNMCDTIDNREASINYRLSKIICKNAPELIDSLIGNFYYRHLG